MKISVCAICVYILYKFSAGQPNWALGTIVLSHLLSFVSLIQSALILVCCGLSFGEVVRTKSDQIPHWGSLTTSSTLRPRLAHCRVRLSKRRAKAGVQSGTNALLVVKHRDMNEKELEAQVTGDPGPGHLWGGWWVRRGTKAP